MQGFEHAHITMVLGEPFYSGIEAMLLIMGERVQNSSAGCWNRTAAVCVAPAAARTRAGRLEITNPAALHALRLVLRTQPRSVPKRNPLSSRRRSGKAAPSEVCTLVASRLDRR